ncbi:hypothetical protein BLL52_3398 [Rhodoferax antarcticus ANT.BR]|uniref:Uncharacterized protein n=1 Tax=Rhodoferax antarcticus ANT.BR TaxID=1111071 RepID=A0A1Q8YBB5_9BURK|nr:hypothetical protein BLL52_3398 [Rhodoferax antarcticus ANT.BR]
MLQIIERVSMRIWRFWIRDKAAQFAWHPSRLAPPLIIFDISI